MFSWKQEWPVAECESADRSCRIAGGQDYCFNLQSLRRALAIEAGIANFDCNALGSVCVDAEIREAGHIAHLQGESWVLSGFNVMIDEEGLAYQLACLRASEMLVSFP